LNKKIGKGMRQKRGMIVNTWFEVDRVFGPKLFESKGIIGLYSCIHAWV